MSKRKRCLLLYYRYIQKIEIKDISNGNDDDNYDSFTWFKVKKTFFAC